MGCHFLLQCIKVKSESEVTQSCPTLSDPMDCSLPGSSVHGIFQTRVLEWGAIAFSVVYTSSSKPWLSIREPETKSLKMEFFFFLKKKLSPGESDKDRVINPYTLINQQLDKSQPHKLRVYNSLLLLPSHFSCVRLCVTP